MNNQKYDQCIERNFPGLFRIEHNISSGITFYHLNDSSFTMDHFMLVSWNCTSGVYRCIFRNINSDIEISLKMDEHDSGGITSSGHMTLPGDILTEESCIWFFEFNIDIYWEFYTNGIGRDYDSYDREAIMRKWTIDNIIKNE